MTFADEEKLNAIRQKFFSGRRMTHKGLFNWLWENAKKRCPDLMD